MFAADWRHSARSGARQYVAQPPASISEYWMRGFARAVRFAPQRKSAGNTSFGVDEAVALLP
jgi:hypothetical protein